MFCKYCGKELEEGTKFCPYCGKMQEESAVNDSVAAQNGINPNKIQPGNKLDSSKGICVSSTSIYSTPPFFTLFAKSI